jgi:hypothetical protein
MYFSMISTILDIIYPHVLLLKPENLLTRFGLRLQVEHS